MRGWKRKGEWLELASPAPDWQALRPQAVSALEALLPVPRKVFLRLASRGEIKVQGDRLLMRLFPEEKPAFMPEPSELDVLYEDDFCLVVNKPAGMSVHPAEPGQRGTLASAVAYYYGSTGQACAVRHIHRLDQDTTGAVLYAKNEWAHVLLDEALRDKRIARRYCAVAQGRFRAKRGTVNEPIGKDRHHAGKRRVSPAGDFALTRYQVLEQMKTAALVELELDTGRTHQIRVHMSHIGHPLAGDTLYGGSGALLQRQALHGESLRFEHPLTREQVHVQAPLPEDMRLLLAKLRV